jgi:hypothetical protein
MPILRCPSCYYATTVRKDSIEGVSCEKCETNLFDYYYKGRSASEATLLITEKGAEFKKKKAKSERDYKKKNISETLKQSSEGNPKSMRNVMSNKESLTESVVGYIIAGAIILSIYGGFQYFQLRSGVQDSTIEMLNDNGYPGYEADGITLPLSAAFGGITTAKVFLKDNSGSTQAIEVEVTQKGIPILSIFTGSEYYTEISGLELMQLK